MNTFLNPVANAWGVLAMEKYSARFESEPVAGQVQTRLEAQQSILEWDKQVTGGSFDFN